MRHASVFAGAALLLFACGGDETVSERVEPEGAAQAADQREEPSESAESGDRCAPLHNELVTHNNSGTPFPFHFDYPRGWEVRETVMEGRVSVDINYTREDRRSSDYVFRLGSSTEPMSSSVTGIVESWPQLGLEVEELALEGGTLHIGKRMLGDVMTVQVLIETAGEYWLVSGGIPTAEDECEEEAKETVMKIFRSLRPNEDQVVTPES